MLWMPQGAAIDLVRCGDWIACGVSVRATAQISSSCANYFGVTDRDKKKKAAPRPASSRLPGSGIAAMAQPREIPVPPNSGSGGMTPPPATPYPTSEVANNPLG